jgi:uncharacterized cupredoxin-like copper-binding protein
MRIARFLVLLVLMTLITAVACGDDDDDDDGGEPSASEEAQSTTEAAGDGEATAVAVSLGEFFVLADPASVPAGPVTFDVTNDSPLPMFPHELVVMRTDLPIDDLPVKDDGAVDEEAEGIEVAGKIPVISPGSTKQLAVDLEAGTYALVCNIASDESHYQKGMWSEFTVE